MTVLDLAGILGFVAVLVYHFVRQEAGVQVQRDLETEVQTLRGLMLVLLRQMQVEVPPELRTPISIKSRWKFRR